MVKARWNDWLWVAMLLYLLLPLYNILYAWLGLIFMVAPILIAVFMADKAYCNKYCGRGQLYQLIGGRFKISRDAKPPRVLRSRWFRHVFLVFFATRFGMLIYDSYMAVMNIQSSGGSASSLLTGRPINSGLALPLAVQLASGIYWMMLASTALGILAMLLFKSRTWCVFCPMGTTTQEICRLRHGKEA